jgi:hypothetical protein
MTVEIRQAGAEWLVEVHGEPIGTAQTAVEALELATHWEKRLNCAALWREQPQLPPSLMCALGAAQVWGRIYGVPGRTKA